MAKSETPRGTVEDARAMHDLMRGDRGPHFRGPDGGWDLAQGLSREDVLEALGVDPTYEGDIAFLSVGKDGEMPVVQFEDIVVTATRPRAKSGTGRPWARFGYQGYFSYRPAWEYSLSSGNETYASAAPPYSYWGNVGSDMRRGWESAWANFRHELGPPTSVDDAFRRGIDVYGTRYLTATLNLAFQPLGNGAGAMLEPIMPDSDAEWMFLQQNREHPSIFDPQHIMTGQERRDLVGAGIVAVATAKVPFGSRAVAAETVGPRTFASRDPLVADLANEIEALYPGHVVGVNVPIRNAAGQLITDADIQLQNAIIQVKSGQGSGLITQLIRTEQATRLPTIGYGPTLKPSIVSAIRRDGYLVTTDRALLLEVVKP